MMISEHEIEPSTFADRAIKSQVRANSTAGVPVAIAWMIVLPYSWLRFTWIGSSLTLNVFIRSNSSTILNVLPGWKRHTPLRASTMCADRRPPYATPAAFRRQR